MKILPIHAAALFENQPKPSWFGYLSAMAVLKEQAIRNVSTNIAVLDTGAHCFPMTINHGVDQDNSFVVSPHTTYARYAKVELERLNKPFLTWPINVLLYGVDRYLQAAQIDKIVQINNQLVSTNLYPKDWHGDDAPLILDFLLSQFPEHALGFRSLNTVQHGVLIEKLQKLGFIAIASRQVYLLDLSDSSVVKTVKKKTTVKRDMQILQKSGLYWRSSAAFNEQDFAQFEGFYNQLYLSKYTRLNPQYTAKLFQAGYETGGFKFQALYDLRDKMVGVIGTICNQHTMTTPIFGYDTRLPTELGLYRALSLQTMNVAIEHGLLLNFSSGVAAFKRNRGAQPAIEYTMVYCQHLDKKRRRAWQNLGILLKHLAIPIMQKYQL
jgi:hypothetical protein